MRKLERDRECTGCRLHKTTSNVCILGFGDLHSKIAIVGEAPGASEEREGRPFIGKAGRLLRRILRDNGFDADKLFITNAVSCRPPDNRTPSKKEITECRSWLDYQFGVVKPKFVLLLGNIPCQSVLNLKGIKNLRGKPLEINGVTYLPTYHPAFALRDPRNLPAIEADIALLRTLVDHGGIPEDADFNPIRVDTKELFKEFLADLRGTVSFDIETSCLYPWRFHSDIKNNPYDSPVITAIGFGTKRAQWSIPFHHFECHPFSNDTLDDMVDAITEKLEDCELVAQNGMFDLLWMKVKYGVDWKLDFDTMLAHYLIDENQQHGLKYLAQIYFGAVDYDVEARTADWHTLSEYHCKDLMYTRKLRFLLGKKLKKDHAVNDVFNHLLMPCSKWFTEAQYNGVFIDQSKMDLAEKFLKGELKTASKELNKWAPGLNWRSPKQIADLLFDQLEIPVVELTKKGGRSTSESVIKRIDHPIGDAILRHRAAAQQLSFFIDGWKPYLVKSRLHPSFKLHGTVTGRLSCKNPNLQQVPRDPRIRSLITAPPGWVLIEADLSQIELRIVAELSGEQNMLASFYNREDIHWKTAMREVGNSGALHDEVMSTVLAMGYDKDITYAKAIEAMIKEGHEKCISVNKSWKENRKKAKAINFGYVYGMWWRKFQMYARDNYGVKVTDAEAEASRKFFFSLYPGLAPWHKRQQEFAKRNGYVTTLSGRKRRLPEAQGDPKDPRTKEALRQAINSPVQGFGNDLCLMSALQITDEYSRSLVRGCGTIHDAVLIIARESEATGVTKRLLKIMEHPAMLDTLNIKLRVPIEAEASIGPWGSGVSLEKWEAVHG